MKVGDFLMKLIFWSGMSQADVARKFDILPPLKRVGFLDTSV